MAGTQGSERTIGQLVADATLQSYREKKWIEL